MKNILPILTCFLLLSAQLSAQITLTQTSYPSSVIGTDSLKKTTYNSSFPSFTAAAGGIWDMNIVTDTTPVYYAYRVPTSTGYQFADSNYYKFSTYTYQGNVLSNILSSGIMESGINIEEAGYSLTSITSGSTDSMIISAQISSYSVPLVKIAFPATLNSSWSSVYSSDFNFQISISPFYDHAPGIVRAYSIEKDTVIGYGKLSVKDALGNPSSYFDVLQVRTMITTVDSFFINGLPATTLLLGYLGLTQGKHDTSFQQNFYRAQEVTPLAQVIFKDAGNTMPKSATTHVQRLTQVAVKKLSSENSINLYPNPLTGQYISIDLPYIPGDWKYELSNTNGRVIKNGTLKVSSGRAQLSLLEVTAGTYYLKLINNDREFCVRPVEIIK